MASHRVAQAAPIRSFFETLAQGGSTSPRVLEACAKAALYRTPLRGRDDVAEDLVAEFLFRILKSAPKNRLAAVASEWAALSDRSLMARLRYRFHQLASEVGGRWPLLKALRQHVSAVIEQPQPFSLMPTTLMENDRISRSRVAEAVGHLLASGAGEEWTVAALSTRLLNHYFPGSRSCSLAENDDIESPANQEHDLEAAEEARELAEVVVSQLGEDQAELFARRGEGEGFAELAKRRKQSVSTVHSKVEKASGVFRLHASMRQASYEVKLGALEELQRRFVPPG